MIFKESAMRRVSLMSAAAVLAVSGMAFGQAPAVERHSDWAGG